MAEPADTRADLGVLLVHGIGDNTQGQTLSQGAEPLVDWLGAWFGLGADREQSAGDPAPARPLGGKLLPPLLSAGEPAHAEIEIGDPQADPATRQRWLFAEAWWEPQVLPPSITEFTVWLLTRGPWTALFHFDQWVLARRPVWQQVLFGLPVLLGWLLLSLAMNTLLLAAAAIALLPVGPLRGVVLRVMQTLAGVLGDAYVLICHPVQRSAFEETTLMAMRWLQPRCQRLAVVAHSQGAAVAHGALQRPDAPRGHLFVTLGAGIAKLRALQWFERRSASDRVAALLAAPVLMAAAAVWLRARQLNLTDVESAWFGPLFLFLVGIGLLARAFWLAREAARHLLVIGPTLALPGTPPGFVWQDIAATHDPVPLGTLDRYFGAIPAMQVSVLPVLRSLWSDHTHYWQAKASFVPHLLTHLARCAGAAFIGLDQADARLAWASARRDFDLRLLRGVRWLDGFALLLPLGLAWPRVVSAVEGLRATTRASSPGAAPVAGTTSSPVAPLQVFDGTLNQAEQMVGWAAGLLSGQSAPAWATTSVNLTLAALLMGLALFVWQRLVFVLWEVWADNRTDEVLQPPLAVNATPASMKGLVLAAAGNTLIDAGLAFVMVMPFGLSVLWTLGRPDWFTEAQAYAMLGNIVVGLMVVALFVSRAHDLAEVWDRWRDPFLQAWQDHAGLAMPARLRASAISVAEGWLRRQNR